MARPVREFASWPFDGVLFWGFIAALAWTPFYFGNNNVVAWGMNAILFPGLVCCYELSLLLRRRPHPVAIKHIGLPAILFALVVLWIVIQCATWTPTSWHHPIWKFAQDAVGTPIAGSISVNRDLSTLAL